MTRPRNQKTWSTNFFEILGAVLPVCLIISGAALPASHRMFIPELLCTFQSLSLSLAHSRSLSLSAPCLQTSLISQSSSNFLAIPEGGTPLPLSSFQVPMGFSPKSHVPLDLEIKAGLLLVQLLPLPFLFPLFSLRNASAFEATSDPPILSILVHIVIIHW